jgi:hypothetical protein
MFMRIKLILAPLIAVFLMYACQKNEITFGTTPVDLTNSAEVRFIYDLPVVSSTSVNITRLKYNDKMVSEVSTSPGGIIPNSAAKYHVVPQGTVKVDAFIGSTRDIIQYSNTFAVGKGKYSVFVYNQFDSPVVLHEADVFPQSDPWADTLAFVRFVNLLCRADGVTPYGTLTLKGRRGAGTSANPFSFYTIATCNFKEASAPVPFKLLKSGTVWSGTETGLSFVLYDSAGNPFKYYPSSTGALTDWSSTGFSLGKGRNYIFHLNGKTGTNYATQAIRLGTIQLN